MAQPSTTVTSALPAVGICGVKFTNGGATIRILEMPSLGGYLVAYDRDTWTRQQVEGYVRMHVGDFELVEPAKAGA